MGPATRHRPHTTEARLSCITTTPTMHPLAPFAQCEPRGGGGAGGYTAVTGHSFPRPIPTGQQFLGTGKEMAKPLVLRPAISLTDPAIMGHGWLLQARLAAAGGAASTTSSSYSSASSSSSNSSCSTRTTDTTNTSNAPTRGVKRRLLQ